MRKKIWLMTSVAGLALSASSVLAQTHAESGDAGNLPGTAQGVYAATHAPLTSITGTHTAGDVDMYLIHICDPASFSMTGPGAGGWDSQLYVFNLDGTGVLFNEDVSDFDLTSSLTNFGGQISVAGDYLIAISKYNTKPYNAANQVMWNLTPFVGTRGPDGPGAPGPVVSWTGAPSASGAYTITLTGACFAIPSVPVDPTISLTAPNGLTERGRTVKVTAVVAPGLNPASTGLVVTADLSQIGGGATQALNDSGANGDLTAGDGVWSFDFAVPAGAFLGDYQVSATVTDAQLRTATDARNVKVVARSWNETIEGLGDAGDLPATAQVPTGSGPLEAISGDATTNDADLFKIEVCDFASFSASTDGLVTWDTQLFLFRLDGVGIISEDDVAVGNLQTTLQGPAVNANGPAFLGISRYLKDPQNAAGQYLWDFDNNIAPDGPGAADPVAMWTNTTAASGPYYIALNGVCYFNPAAPTPILASAAIRAGDLVEQGRSVLFKVTVTPGSNPPSTGLTVTGDLTQFGGSGAQALNDSGANGDEAAGDGIYSYLQAIPAAQSVGPVSATFTVSDSQSRSASPSVSATITTRSWSEAVDGGGDAGSLPGTAQAVTGTGAIGAITGNHGAGDVDMYKINVCDASSFAASTENQILWDSQIYTFRLDGTGLLFNDDVSDDFLQAALVNTGGVISNGPILLAITRYNNKPANEAGLAMWNLEPFTASRPPDGPGASGAVTSWLANPAAAGNYRIELTGACAFDPTASTDPFGSASIRAGDLVEQTRSVLFKVAVSPGTNPASTGITVTGDLSQFGGSATQIFYDNQTNGDEVAGDGVYSYLHSIPGSAAVGPVTATFTIADAQLRDSTVSLSTTLGAKSWSELVDGGGDAGDLPVSAQQPTGNDPLSAITGSLPPGDVDMFLIKVCDTSTFNVSTDTSANEDTQLWLFNLDGTGVMFNDDAVELWAGLNNFGGQITAPGNFYLAITGWDSDALDASAAQIWNDLPYLGVRAPDGPGAPNPLNSWIGGEEQGDYRMVLTGVCYAGPTGCNAADIATAGNPDPQAGPDGFLTGDDFDLFINAFFNELRRTSNNTLIADMVDGDGNPPPDGFLTGSDFDYFLAKFFAGC